MITEVNLIGITPEVIQDKDFDLVVNEIQKMFYEIEQTYGVN